MRFTQVCGRTISCQSLAFWFPKCDCGPKLFGWWGSGVAMQRIQLNFFGWYGCGGNDFSSFWVGVIRLERDGLICVMGLSKLGGLVGPFFYEFKLACTWPT